MCGELEGVFVVGRELEVEVAVVGEKGFVGMAERVCGEDECVRRKRFLGGVMDFAGDEERGCRGEVEEIDEED